MIFRKSLAALLAGLIFVAQAVTPAAAMFGVTGLAGFGVTTSGTAYSIVDLGTVAWSSGSTISGSVNIGAADANKEIFIVTSTRGIGGTARTLTAASTTVDGNAVTKFTTEATETGQGYAVAGGFVSVPTSSGSVTITATFSAALTGGQMEVFAVYSRPKTSGSNQTDQSGASGTGTTCDANSTTINANGLWFGGSVHRNTNATTSPGDFEPVDVTDTFNRFIVNYRSIQGSSSTPADQWSWSGSVVYICQSWSFD